MAHVELRPKVTLRCKLRSLDLAVFTRQETTLQAAPRDTVEWSVSMAGRRVPGQRPGQ